MKDTLSQIKPGDPDPTSDSGLACGVQWLHDPTGPTWICTRSRKHRGQHIAGADFVVAAVLPAKDPTDDLRSRLRYLLASFGRRGDDGLTSRQRKMHAKRWQRTGGRLPSREEAMELMKLADSQGDSRPRFSWPK